MKNSGLILLVFSSLFIISCSKDDDDVSERVALLTSTIWEPVSLLVNGADASGPGQLLADFNGDVNFNEDGTGSFGEYDGTWTFAANETQIIITTEALDFPITALIEELTSNSLIITTSLLNQDIRMTFRAK
jgi:hypothetical protein